MIPEKRLCCGPKQSRLINGITGQWKNIYLSLFKCEFGVEFLFLILSFIGPSDPQPFCLQYSRLYSAYKFRLEAIVVFLTVGSLSWDGGVPSLPSITCQYLISKNPICF